MDDHDRSPVGTYAGQLRPAPVNVETDSMPKFHIHTIVVFHGYTYIRPCEKRCERLKRVSERGISRLSRSEELKFSSPVIPIPLIGRVST